jgi:hypothetical protein
MTNVGSLPPRCAVAQQLAVVVQLSRRVEAPGSSRAEKSGATTTRERMPPASGEYDRDVRFVSRRGRTSWSVASRPVAIEIEYGQPCPYCVPGRATITYAVAMDGQGRVRSKVITRVQCDDPDCPGAVAS